MWNKKGISAWYIIKIKHYSSKQYYWVLLQTAAITYQESQYREPIQIHGNCFINKFMFIKQNLQSLFFY